MSKITTAEVLAHEKQIDILRDTKDKERKQGELTTRHLTYDVFNPKIRLLEQRRDKAVAKICKHTQKVLATLDDEINDQYVIIEQVKRILACLETYTDTNLSISDSEIEPYERYGKTPYKEGLGYLFNDDHLKIKMFIIGNDKPVNKYSLIAIGRSHFTEPLIKLPRSYGLDINTWNTTFNIELGIKDMASVEELKAYYDKHKDTILKDEIAEYKNVKAEYVQTIKDYKIEDFKELITWQCPTCNSFYSIFDNLATNYTPKCHRHDPAIDMIRTNKEKS